MTYSMTAIWWSFFKTHFKVFQKKRKGLFGRWLEKEASSFRRLVPRGVWASRGQFGIWRRACPRLLDPIRQPCCLVCKANLENLQLSLCYKSGAMSTSIISNLCYKHGGNKLLNSACHSRRQGGHLGPVFIWIHTRSNNNNSSDSGHCEQLM